MHLKSDAPILRDVRFVAAWTLVTAVGFAVMGVLFHNFPVAYRMPPVWGDYGRFDRKLANHRGFCLTRRPVPSLREPPATSRSPAPVSQSCPHPPGARADLKVH